MILKTIYKKINNNLIKKKFKTVIFHKYSEIDIRCFFEGFNSVGMFSKLNSIYLGRGTYLGRNNELTSVKIGNFCSIGSFIINTTGRHPSSVFVSTHPAFFSKGKAAGFNFINENKFDELSFVNGDYLVEIGNDVWIGDRVTIMDGVKIGDGAIIGSNALVTKDIAPYTINVGVPARVIRKRFTDDEISSLKKTQWWNNDISWLQENAHYFENINSFLNKINHE